MAWIAAGGAVLSGFLSSQGDKGGGSTGPTSADMEKAYTMIRKYTNRTRNDIFNASKRSQTNLMLGKRKALDVFKEAMPRQVNAFREGNINAQRTTSGGLSPQIAAIMGQELDLSSLQPKGIDAPMGWVTGLQMPNFNMDLPAPSPITGFDQKAPSQSRPPSEPQNTPSRASPEERLGQNVPEGLRGLTEEQIRALYKAKQAGMSEQDIRDLQSSLASFASIAGATV